ncbi:HAMP domain-containing sensor histidine kinase [Anaerocolumna aminovalerica]|jgi:signal transduction histidine kinase|uniref:histidine kinase n=1 Tax=Anaerocolumna aminovalerica TaxID=1527 RepID=A0A1I5ITI8_9FIRM|nr:HAMP domain-containing sensor histidine kinase [Anaerocolumna aminovalerica]MBU5334568.1 HAMP domain-containing histidine kinase [Anaerocolumna aminovalerica]MDU6263559.1 HAMP domain-containing sensor histidine kinase [Anaerocolumna aminovalerica]SFO63802.1 Signal transduction histidine kinase [Anaerocolumna aminovalerica]
MKRKLWFNLFICYILAAVFMFTLLNTFGINRIEKKMTKEKRDVLYNEAASISSEYMNSFYKNQTSLDRLTNQIKVIGNILNARIWIVNKSGLVISDTRPEDSKVKEINVLNIDPDFLSETFSDYTVMPGVLREPMLSVVLPVSYNYQVQGFIVIHSALSQISNDAIYFVDGINLIFLAFLAFLCILFFVIYFFTIAPLSKLNKAAKEYTSGNYSYPLKLDRSDEYGDLANSLSYMAGEMNKLDDYQKKFVANISHDFRSPLTSIKGYAEAILDGTIPYEMKDKYLGIILFETERLNKLTSSLLTLNRFENRGTFLEITSFDINHIIKKTAESFEGTCTKKKITLNLVFSAKEIYVDADMGKIQQVLYNLLDNAIKFSPQNSSIKVATTEKGDKAFVSIKDYGIGIPKENIKKIWERFYKTDASRGKDKKGTGLGLSITKEIITAHDENINVISTKGVGTEFIFSLPRTDGFLI